MEKNRHTEREGGRVRGDSRDVIPEALYINVNLINIKWLLLLLATINMSRKIDFNTLESCTMKYIKIYIFPCYRWYTSTDAPFFWDTFSYIKKNASTKFDQN